MEKICGSPKGFWRDHSVIKKLSKEAKVSEKHAFGFLKNKQKKTKKKKLYGRFIYQHKNIIRLNYN